MMTDAECLKEVKKLESALLRFPPHTHDDQEFWDRRRMAIFEAVERFGVDTLRQAFRRFAEAGGEQGYGFPTVPEIVAECTAVASDGEPAEQARRTFPRFAHACAKQAAQCSPALLTLAALWPYESAHILCAGEIPATCPECGVRHVELGAFDALIDAHPGDTGGWTRYFKGYLLCAACAKKGK